MIISMDTSPKIFFSDTDLYYVLHILCYYSKTTWIGKKKICGRFFLKGKNFRKLLYCGALGHAGFIKRFSVKGQAVNMSDSVGCVFSVITSHLCRCTVEADISS